MKITLDLPRDWEVRSCEINGKTQIVLEPLFFRNQKAATVLFATAVGDSGRENHTLISVSGATGALSTTTIRASGAPVAFDRPEGPEAPEKPEEQKAKPEVLPGQENARQT